MANRPIRIAILADAGKAKKELDDVSSKASKMGDRFSKLRTPALAVAGGFAAVGVGLLKLSQGAAEDERAQKTLAQTMRATAGATDGQVAAMEAYISKVGAATGVTDDEMRPALGNLLRATKDTGKAQDLMNLAMDASAGTGKSLESITLALAKAQNGSTGALGKLGIATKDASGKALSYDQIVKNMSTTFSGQAATAAETLEGKQKRLRLTLAETGEALGAKLLPALTAGANMMLTKFVPALESAFGWAERNKTTLMIVAGVIGGLAAAVLIVNGVLAAWSGIMAVVTIATKAWAIAQGALNLVMMLNPIGLVVLAIVALIAILVLAYKKSETFRKIVDGAFGAVKTGGAALVAWFKGLPGAISGAVGNVTGKLTQKGKDFIAGLKTGFDDVVDFLADVGAIPGRVVAYIGTVTSKLSQKGRDFISGLISGAQQRAADLWTWLSGIPGTIGSNVGDLSRTLYSAGQNVVRGLLNGISSLAGRVAGAARDLASKITGPVAKFLRIGSPSKLFRQYGRWTVEGLAMGLQERAGLAASAAGDLAGRVASGFDAPELAISTDTGGATGDASAGGDTYVFVTIDGQQLEGRITKVIKAKDRQLKRALTSGAGRVAPA